MRGLGCLVYIFIWSIYVAISTCCVTIILSWFDVTMPLIARIGIGVIGGEFAIPIAIIGSILKCFGVF